MKSVSDNLKTAESLFVETVEENHVFGVRSPLRHERVGTIDTAANAGLG